MGDEQREFTPDRSHIDVSRDPTPGVPDHLRDDDVEPGPLIDLTRDPTPGHPDHAMPDEEEDSGRPLRGDGSPTSG